MKVKVKYNEKTNIFTLRDSHGKQINCTREECESLFNQIMFSEILTHSNNKSYDYYDEDVYRSIGLTGI